MKLPDGAVLDFSGPALIMAIINCNEDSFYAPSRASGEKAVEAALAAERDGASIIDFGGESTRPGSFYISEEEELRRVIPAIEAFRKRSALPVSVDTRKAAVARAALEAGAGIVNDISALADDPETAAVSAEYGAAVVLMHKKGVPATMRDIPRSENIRAEIRDFFAVAAERALAAGIPRDKIILDPGIGFGKTLEDNLEILRCFSSGAGIAEMFGNDYPVLVGLSRKSFIGELTGRDAASRLAGTLAANAAAVMGGAAIIRVHDVKEHADLAKILFALKGKNGIFSEL